jgi:hypothetical protein
VRAQRREGTARPSDGSRQRGSDRGRPEAAHPEVLGAARDGIGADGRRRPEQGMGNFSPRAITGWGVGRVWVADPVNGLGPLRIEIEIEF